MFFYARHLFCSGHKQCNLRFKPAQVDLVDRAGETAYVRYTEDISKNNPGGLKGRTNPKWSLTMKIQRIAP
jgi:hypothetical protein